MEELVSVLRLGHFVSLSARDVALSQALNSDQLAQMLIKYARVGEFVLLHVGAPFATC